MYHQLSFFAAMLSVRRACPGFDLGLQQASLGAWRSVRGTPGIGDSRHGRPGVEW